MKKSIKVRKGMPDVALSKAEFTRRIMQRFYDPVFDKVPEIKTIIDKAWIVYDEYHKSPRVHPAGKGFHDPKYELSDEWRAAHEAVVTAEKKNQNKKTRPRILVVNGSSRSDQSCPGEMSKTFRLTQLAMDVIKKERGFDADFLDLSLLTSQYGRIIYPCKACVSTALPLCHWPCSCYPNHAIGQVNDWMAEIYPMWVAAHGIMIVCPVNWYQAPSSLKLMIDRLVCADGGNADPTTTTARTRRRRRRSNSRAGIIRATSRGVYFRSSCMAMPPAPKTSAHLDGLASRYGANPGGQPRFDRSICRLSRALRDEPRRSRQGQGFSEGRPDRNTFAHRGGEVAPRRKITSP